jgi:RNA polymerase sigma-70 factor (ECF subfamily)
MGNTAAAARQEPRPPGRKSRRDALVRAFSDVRDELTATLYYLLGNHDDAQDMAQEAFLKCWRKPRCLVRVRNLRAWIFRVGVNAAKDLQRNAWRRRMRPLEAAVPRLEPERCAPAEVIVRHEETDRLRVALLDLRREEKEVFLLRQNGDLTYEQIARMLRRPVGTVKTQMRAALQKLRGVLREARAGCEVRG